MSLTVIGIDGAPLPPGAARALAAAEVVAGAGRYLDLGPASAERVEMGAVGPALRRLDGRRGVVLASGDPGFFGIVRLLRAAGHEPVVFAARSSVARAFARVGRPWDDVAVVSAHGRALRPAVNVCRARAATAVLTAPGAGPAEIGAALAGWERTLVVAEDLDGPHERLTTLSPAEAAARSWREPNVLLCLRDPAAVPPVGWYAGSPPLAATDGGTEAPDTVPPDAGPGWALPEESFTHRGGMITKSEVRALALARLAPGPGTLVWDVGAGSGAVAVECARLGAAVVAVERRPDDADRVRANAAAHGVDVRVVPGMAPDVLAGLPEPDAVFVGGGGPEVVEAVTATGVRRIVVALAALDRIAPTRAALRGYRVEGVQLAASRLAELPDGSVRLAATNPILLLWGTT
ncbi:precorrin-6y C5,15-methyltransferase (decarboxylating) subunit CbiE [Pseudonocardia sp.]|uniref:precorrin-6y C5,15-methyltransferase (decarboxylating) subunit CbiE n=1 Tax=Pseudonocardia sp. TaxID=60912 RepID=UPI002632DC7F|nr:precorrin-6y C5,15-methyltransferase (decarboxylating) subunit CbiE [Pseudonocardia sp.]